MRVYLINTAEGNILVSDEGISQDDLICRISTGEVDTANDEWDNDKHSDWKKIVASDCADHSIPCIDYNKLKISYKL